MSALTLCVWMINIAFDTGGQLAFKAASVEPHTEHEGMARWSYMLGRPWIWLGVACYVIEFASWIAFLSLVPLSVGVMLGSIDIVVIMLGGRWLFGEQLSPLRLMGITLVTLGVVVVGASG